MKKLIIFLLCVAVLCGGGYFGYKRYMKQKEEKIVVDVVSVSKMYEPGYYLNGDNGVKFGYIMDNEAQKVYLDSQKLVAEVFVEEGQEVKKGDPLFEYDMTVVELELAQKENKTKVIEEDIKKANKDLESIKKYKPSENAPKEPEINWNDYFPEPEPEPEPEVPAAPETVPVYRVDEVVPSTAPADGNGSPETPLIYTCKPSTRIDKVFFLQTVSDRRYAEICVYNDSSEFMYKWIIDPDTPIEGVEDWTADTGVSIDGSGAVTLNSGAAMPAKLSFARPKSLKYGASPDELVPDSVTTDAEDMIIPEMPPQQSFDIPSYTYEEPKIDPNNHDYQYTKKEIENLIIKKQDEIKKLELDLKKANREIETYKKRQKDGKELAEIDGVVRKIGKPSAEEEEEAEKTEEELFASPDPDENAFAVVEGEGGTECLTDLHELELADYAEGTKVIVTSFMTQESCEGEVRKIDETPMSYTSDEWGMNPNGSTFRLHIKLDEPDKFSLYDSVSIQKINDEGERIKNNDSILIPMHYVRQEGGDYYIMRESEDGKLEKKYVSTGAILDLTIYKLIEIKGGISVNDNICFPYGKDVKEGVRTRETDTVLYPDGTMGGIG